MAQTCKYAVEIDYFSLMSEDSTLSLYNTFEEAVTAFQEECLDAIPHLSPWSEPTEVPEVFSSWL